MLDAVGTRYGRLPSELVKMDPASFSFDYEVMAITMIHQEQN